VTVLRFPAEIAVGEVWWEDPREPGEWGHRLATGEVEVPDGTAVTLSVSLVAEVGVSAAQVGLWAAPAGTILPPRQVRRPQPRVTWRPGTPGSAFRNDASVWGGPEDSSYYVKTGHEAVDLGFIRDLPADSVVDLALTGEFVPASFAAVTHLAPGLRDLSVYVDSFGADAPSVIAELTALERLSVAGHSLPEDGPVSLIDDHALSALAGLPALEALSLLGGSYTEDGLRQLSRLPKLRHLHVERGGLTPAMFRFAATMPALTELEGMDEDFEHPWTPAQVDQLRALLPHISVC
jgi:hypothetical protein